MKSSKKWWFALVWFVLPLTFSRAEGPEMKMEEVVVTGTRLEESVKNIPNAVVIIREKEISSSSARNLGELLADQGIVEVSGYGYLGASQSAGIRGSSASQVLVLIDGRPTNSMTYGSADLSEISLDQVERIEIVKGPGSHIYGANAVGGVIQVVTKRPPAKPSLEAGVSYGSFNTFTARGEHGQTLDRLGYLLNAGYQTSDGHRDNSAYQGKDFSAKLYYQILDRLGVSLRSAYHQNDLGVPGPEPAAGTPPVFGNDKVTSLYDHQDSTLFSNHLQLNWVPLEALQLRWQAYQDYRELLYRQRYLGYPSAVEDHSTYKTNIYGTSLDARWAFHPDHRLTVGAEFRKEKLDAEQSVKDLSTAQVIRTRWEPDNRITALFGQEHWQALGGLHLVGGIRYDHTTRYGSKWSPDLGVIFLPQGPTRIKFHYGEAFRPPTFNDLFWPGFGNQDLAPEKGTAYELSFEHALKDKQLTFNGGLFYTEVKDKIQWVPDASGVWSPQNVNQQKNRGMEFELNWSPGKHWSLSFAYTYLDAKQHNRELVNAVTNETQMAERRAMGVPEHQLRLKTAYTLPWGTRLFLTLRYLGDRFMYYDDYSRYPQVGKLEKKVEAHYTLDVKASQVFARHWEVYLSLLNLTDQKYLEQAGTSYNDRGYPAPGRSLTAGVNYKF